MGQRFSENGRFTQCEKNAKILGLNLSKLGQRILHCVGKGRQFLCILVGSRQLQCGRELQLPPTDSPVSTDQNRGSRVSPVCIGFHRAVRLWVLPAVHACEEPIHHVEHEQGAEKRVRSRYPFHYLAQDIRIHTVCAHIGTSPELWRRHIGQHSTRILKQSAARVVLVKPVFYAFEYSSARSPPPPENLSRSLYHVTRHGPMGCSCFSRNILMLRNA